MRQWAKPLNNTGWIRIEKMIVLHKAIKERNNGTGRTERIKH